MKGDKNFVVVDGTAAWTSKWLRPCTANKILNTRYNLKNGVIVIACIPFT